MTSFKRGDIVLVEFAYAQGGGSKKRPALVISVEAYHRSRHEVILAAVTSNVERNFLGDTLVTEWETAGLLAPSVVTGIVRTIKREMILKTIGRLTPMDYSVVEENLKKVLGF